MDKRTQRALIVSLRNKGLKFREIAEILEREHGIKVTRQGVQSIYQRATESRNIEKISNKLLLNGDVINIYCLGYNMRQTTDIVNELGNTVSYTDVNNIINSEKEYIDEVNEAIINKCISCLDDAMDKIELSQMLVYKGVTPSDKGMTKIIKSAYTKIMKDEAATIIAQAFQLTDDRKLVRDLIELTNIDIKIKDISDKLQ